MNQTKPSNPKDRAATDRIDISLFPQTAIAYGALAMVEGDCKYGGYNWRVAGVSPSCYFSACCRHLFKWYNGEWNDPTTGVPHLASALACIAIIIDAKEAGKLNDDRPPCVELDALMERMRAIVRHLHELYPNGPERFTQQKTPPGCCQEGPQIEITICDPKPQSC